MGWPQERRALRHAAEAGFEVFLTGDQNLQFQQNLTQAKLSVVVLVAPSNRLKDLVPLVPPVLEAISRSQPGQVTRISR